MRFCSERELIRCVAERWKQQYHGGRSAWTTIYGDQDSEAIYHKLAALNPETATAAEVTAAIGNPSWSAYFCGVCTEYRPCAMEFGSDYTTYVCEECMKKAIALFQSPSSAGEKP